MEDSSDDRGQVCQLIKGDVLFSGDNFPYRLKPQWIFSTIRNARPTLEAGSHFGLSSISDDSPQI